MNKVVVANRYKTKRLVVLIFDVLTIAVVSLLALPAFSEPAWAYVDPSVMTYTIQALAGVAVALSAVAGVAFRRTRKALLKAMDIDENAKKEVDTIWRRIECEESNLGASVSSFDDGAISEGTNRKRRKKDASASNQQGEALSWGKRFIISFLVALFCGVTLGISAPIETVAGAAGDLLFSPQDVLIPLVVVTFLVATIVALVMTILPKRVFAVIATLVFCFGFCCYLQAMALNEGLPAADGRAVDWWGAHTRMMEISLVVWIALLVIPAIASSIKPKVAIVVVSALSVALVLVQGVGVTSLLLDSGSSTDSSNTYGAERERVYGTEMGLFDVSSKNNVVVFVLDMYDTRTLQAAVEQSPELLDEMGGFTWYQNSVGPMLPTNFALPYLITGSLPASGQSLESYNVTRYTDSNYLKTLHDANYFVGIYSPMLQLNYLNDEQAFTNVFANVDNFHGVENFEVNTGGALKSLAKVALYRDMPWVLKGRFRFYTDDLNQGVLTSGPDAPEEDMIYVLDDGKYYQRLLNQGLAINDGDYNGAFKLIHLNGPHFPYNVDEHGVDVGEGNSTKEQQAIGSMGMVSEYLRDLKDLGVYDDCTIIITADHGDWAASPDLPTDVTSPIVLVKRPHAGNGSVTVSDSPVSHSDIFGTVFEAMDINVDGNLTRYDDAFAADRVRVVYQIGVDDQSHIRNLFEYEVVGDVLDFSNWHYTGQTWYGDIINK